MELGDFVLYAFLIVCGIIAYSTAQDTICVSRGRRRLHSSLNICRRRAQRGATHVEEAKGDAPSKKHRTRTHALAALQRTAKD